MKGIRMLIITAFITALYMVSAANEALDYPHCTSKNEAKFTYIENCRMFYACSNGEAILHECPDDLLFCSENEECSYADDKYCSFSDCVVPTPHELRTADEPLCPITADNETVFLPNANNCSMFYMCAFGIPVPFDCPADLWFCSEKDMCAHRYDVNCSFSDCNQATPHELRMADEPHCPITADNETVFLPNSNNCSTFYMCAFGIPVPFDCPADLWFCSEKDMCAHRYDVNCSFSDCNQVTPHSLRMADEPHCPITADNETVFLPNANNCSTFYMCAFGIPVPFDCPAHLWFCSEKDMCAHRYDVNCSFSDCNQVTPHELRMADDPQCPITADNETVFLPNSNNCSTFYVCAFGIPVPFDCPAHLWFCSEKDMCAHRYDINCSFPNCNQATPHELRIAEAPNCPTVQHNETVLLPNSQNCSTFYVCASGMPVPFECPADLWFCSEKNLCSYVNDEECTYSDCTKIR